MASNQSTELIKFSVCLYKHEHVSWEDLTKFATVDYPPRAVPVMKRHGLQKWTVTLNPPHFREPMREALKTQMNRPKWTIPDYDVIMTYWIRDLSAMGPLTQDPDWLKLEEDAMKIANLETGSFLIGHETVEFQTDEVPGPVHQ
ncbi:hypothetical protein BX600DRAFT_474624 [Xylariales sp. PMI_506]|nr:hypothetical protein BX600DRAFT_474624 [Xylariales sp. PMI_506]